MNGESGRGILNFIMIALCAAAGKQFGGAIVNKVFDSHGGNITISEFKELVLDECDKNASCDEDVVLSFVDGCWPPGEIEISENQAPGLQECLGRKSVSHEFIELCAGDTRCNSAVLSNFDVCWDDSDSQRLSGSSYRQKSFIHAMAKCINEEGEGNFFYAKG